MSLVLKEVNGTPVYIRDVAEVTIGHRGQAVECLLPAHLPLRLTITPAKK